MSINLKSTETGYQTISDAIAALPAAGDTIIIRNETVSQFVTKLMPLQSHTMLNSFNDAILK